jgi:hypothetical protein
MYALLFWIGVFILLSSHITLYKTMPDHSKISLFGLTCMFVGSKIGREFLGIKKIYFSTNNQDVEIMRINDITREDLVVSGSNIKLKQSTGSVTL